MNNKIISKILIILPTYNERNNISFTIKDILSILPKADILVVDDNSPDGTAEIVTKLTLRFSNLALLKRPLKTGLGDAYKDAIKRVIKDKSIDAVIMMDADGSHQAKYLKDFLTYIKDYDLIIGSRYTSEGGVRNWELWRKMLSKFGNLYAGILTGMEIRDLTAGFMCVTRELLERIDFNKINSTGYAFLMEFKFYCVHKLGANFKEVPIIFKERSGDRSKISNRIIFEGVKTPLKIFIRRLFN